MGPRLGVSIGAVGTDGERLVELVRWAEALGCGSVWSGESYGNDAVAPLAYAAASTDKIQLGTGIMQMPGRSPAMTGMTALTMSALTGGRFALGLGLSGPRVAEGWHGVSTSRPLTRTREYVAAVRQVLSGQTLELDGRCYQIPYQGADASGLGLPLRPMLRTEAHIPVYLAAIGPKNVALSVEIADGLLPVLWSPTRWRQAYGDVFDAASESFDLAPTVWIALGDDLAECRDRVRRQISFYLGAMGPIGKNFYAELVSRYGYEDAVQQVATCWAEGRSREATAHVPDELVDEVGLVGPKGHVAEQLDRWRGSPVTTIIVETADLQELEVLADLLA